jgi:hypothetical protein
VFVYVMADFMLMVQVTCDGAVHLRQPESQAFAE